MLTNNNIGIDKSYNKTRGQSFARGVLFLSASTLICKVIGLLFKIPIIHIVGIEGMAFFASAYNVYMLLNSIAAAGLPVALSILISKNTTEGNTRNARKIFRIAMGSFALIGIVATLILYYGADLYSESIGIPDAAPAVRTIAPTIILITLAGGFRGYFQGHESMAPTAISQLIESLGKLVLGIGLASLAVSRSMDLPYVAAAAVLGLSLGELASVFYLFCRYAVFRKKTAKNISESPQVRTESNLKIIGQLFWIALPITLSSCLTSLTTLADTALITNGLIASGFDANTAVALYSSYTNLAVPMFNLIPALVTPLAVSLIPTITSSITRGDRNESSKVFSSSVRLCLAFSIPAAAGLAVFSKPILDLIYPSESEACVFAAPLLSMLSVAIVFSCMTTILNAVLQSYMKPSLPIVSMTVGALVKIVLEYVLVRTSVGVLGAPISTVAGCFVILLLNILFLSFCTPHKLEIMPFVRAFAATVVCIISASVVYATLIWLLVPFQIALLASICVAVAVYAFVALKIGVISEHEIVYLPRGKRILPLLRKMKLLK